LRRLGSTQPPCNPVQNLPDARASGVVLLTRRMDRRHRNPASEDRHRASLSDFQGDEAINHNHALDVPISRRPEISGRWVDPMCDPYFQLELEIVRTKDSETTYCRTRKNKFFSCKAVWPTRHSGHDNFPRPGDHTQVWRRGVVCGRRWNRWSGTSHGHLPQKSRSRHLPIA
jgi:hypothetical protein